MPTEKPLPDPDEDIIDLTDLVEEEKDAGDDAPVDLSFEQELDDLFGDVEPDPVKPAAKAGKTAPADDDDDALDLAGFDLDAAPPEKPGKRPPATDDDDALDLTGLDLEADDDTPHAAATDDDDALDLGGFDLDDTPPQKSGKRAPAKDDDDPLDLAGLGLDDDDGSPAATADEDDALDLGGFDLDDAPPQKSGKRASAKDDDDALDLEGLGFDDDDPGDKPLSMGEDDDGLDLAGLGLDEDDDAPHAAATDEDDGLDLGGLGLDDDEPGDKPLSMGEDDDGLDLAGLGLDEDDDAPHAAVADEDDGLDLGGLDLDDHAGAAPADDADSTADLFGDAEASSLADGDEDIDFPSDSAFDEAPGAGPEATQAAAPTDDALDLADIPLDAFESEPLPPVKAAKAVQQDPAMDDLLDELPEAPEPGDADAPAMEGLSTLPSLEDVPQQAAPAPATATGGATLAAVAATATATSAIDLASLDKLIDTAKPAPGQESRETPDPGRLDALAQRLDSLEKASSVLGDKLESLPPAVDGEALAARLESLETANATLCDKLEALPPAVDGEGLAAAMSAKLEDALTERLEAIMAGQPRMPDTEALKTQILADAAEHATSQHAALVTEMRESLTRLESLTGSRQDQFKDFATAVETQLGELRSELPKSGTCATNETLAASMETLGEKLSREIAGKLDERMSELRRELRESLGADLAKALEERMAGIVESARQAAHQEVQGLGEALSGRIEALEADRLDPDSVTERVTEVLTDRVRDALAPSLEQLEVKLDRSDLDKSLTALRERLETTMGKEDFDAAVSALRARLEAKLGRDELDAALAASLEPLEDKVDRQDLEDALDSLREELTEEIKSAIPKVAATIIREEISALAKEMQ